MAKVINVSEASKNVGETFYKTNSVNASKTHPDTASKAFEEILKIVGDKNSYQWKLLGLCGLLGIFTGFHNIGAVYLAATPRHNCDIPYLSKKNLTNDEAYINISVPWVYNKLNKLTPDKCNYYDYDFSRIQDTSSITRNDSIYKGIETIPCTAWVYDRSVFISTVVSEWNLVCDRRWLMSTTQASYMFGILMGAVITSALSDKFGRRLLSLICTTMFIISTISVSFSNSLATFLVLRFIVAFAGHGAYLANYVLCMENVGEKGRSYIGSLFHSFFGFGFIALNLFAYLLRDWRHLQLCLSVPTVLLLGYFWLLPKSPRWLLMQGREEEGVEILKKIAAVNNKEFPPDEEIRPLLNVIAKEIKNKPNLSMSEKIKATFTNIGDLIRTKNMRRRSLILFYSWFVVSMLYYGLAFAGHTINASIYLSVTVSALAEIPSVISSFVFVMLLGRRVYTCFCFLTGGLCCICVAFVPTGLVGLNLALATIGKICISIAFSLVYILSAELVPTSVRNLSLGSSSMFARIGSTIAPYIVDLLGDLYYATPFIIFGVLAVVAGLLCMLLPETKNKRLPESIDEIELMSR